LIRKPDLLSRARTFVLLAFALLPLTGCLLRTHRVERTVSTAPLRQATLADLVNRIDSDAAKIKTLNATVDIATSVGGAKKGKVTEYQEIRGYVLVRKPGMLRMIGLFPVVRNRAFDMVSDGQQFRLSIPPRNKFIVGTKDVKNPSDKPSLENLRPQQIMDALLLREIDPNDEISVLENATDVVQDTKVKKAVEEPNYVVDVIHHGADGTWLSRKVFFSRTDLQPRKQILYDKAGNVATIATYDNFSLYDGVMFPNIIEIQRPQEEYTIQLGMVKLNLNQPLRDDQFELQQPTGSQLQVLDGASYDVPVRSSKNQFKQFSRSQQQGK
jgi:outer membrane lipoprotein-sorting protein